MTDQPRLSRSEWIAAAVGRHEAQLVRYAARLTGDLDRARDVTQETFLRLCREAEPEKLDGRLAQWLFTVCRNLAFDVHRKEDRMKSLSPGTVVEETRQAPALAGMEGEELAERLLSGLDRLPTNQQEVVRLKFQNGFSYRKISEITSLTVTNVGYLLHTAIHTLRAELNPSGAGDRHERQ